MDAPNEVAERIAKSFNYFKEVCAKDEAVCWRLAESVEATLSFEKRLESNSDVRRANVA